MAITISNSKGAVPPLGIKPAQPKKATEPDWAAILGAADTPKEAPKETPKEAHLEAQVVTGETTVTKVSKGQESILVDTSDVVLPSVEVGGCRVSVTGGRTINIGNYESVKIGVTLTMPATLEGIDSAYDFASNWVSKKIEDATTTVTED